MEQSNMNYFYADEKLVDGTEIKYSFKRLLNPADINHKSLQCD